MIIRIITFYIINWYNDDISNSTNKSSNTNNNIALIRMCTYTPRLLLPISQLKISLPRFVDSNFLGNSLWT